MVSLLKNINQVQRVFLGMLLGILVGFLCPKFAVYFEFLGVIFLNLLKMVTIPLIFFTILYGITSVETYHGLYRISLKAITAFLVTACFAVIIGISTSLLMKPGYGVTLPILNSAGPLFQKNELTSVLKNLIPSNIFTAFVEGNILQIIIFAFFLGSILNLKREICEDVIKLSQQLAQVFFKMIEIILVFAPFGVFGYIAAMVGREGLDIITNLSKLILVIFVGCVIQYIVFGLMILFFCKMSPIPFYKKILGPQILAFTTSSSKATLVPLMQIAEEKLGISKRNSRFLLPLSAALNMDGGAIYQASCAIFFGQVFGVTFSYGDYAVLIMMCTIASIGGAGIPSGVLLFLGMVLNSVNLPMEGVLIIAGIDRILDMMTTTINVTGDACVTLLIDASEKTLNRDVYNNMST